MKSKKVLVIIILAVILMTTLCGCVPGDGRNTQADPAGFLWGIWHGWIAPVSLIYSIFNRNIGIYEVYNTGFWYDLGYYMAIISGFGGLTLSRKKRKKSCSAAEDS